jgi:PAS domain-containing protein
MPTADTTPRTAPPLLDLPALRRQTLDQMILLAAVVTTCSGALAFVRNLSVGWSPLVFVNLIVVPALLWSLHLGRRGLSYQSKAILFILCLWGLAINALAYSAGTAFIAARRLHSLDATVQALDTQTEALRETQAQLQAALNRQRAIFNNSSAGIALLDGERTILDASPRFCALLGYRDADLVGQSTRRIHPDQAAFEALCTR